MGGSGKVTQFGSINFKNKVGSKKPEEEQKEGKQSRKRVTFDCPPGLYKQLKFEAVRQEVAIRELIVAAIENLLMEETGEMKAAEYDPKEKRKRVTFECSPHLHKQLKFEAVRLEITIKQLIVVGIENVLIEE